MTILTFFVAVLCIFPAIVVLTVFEFWTGRRRPTVKEWVILTLAAGTLLLLAGATKGLVFGLWGFWFIAFAPWVFVVLLLEYVLTRLRPTGVLRKRWVTLMVVAGIFAFLGGEYFYLGYLARVRQEDMAKNTGTDELSRVISNEAAEYRAANLEQQRGIFAVTSVVGAVTVVWGFAGRRRLGSVRQTVHGATAPPHP